METATVQPEEKWLGKVGEMYEKHTHDMSEQLSGSAVQVSQKINIAGFDIEVTDEDATNVLRKQIVEEAEKGQTLRNRLKKAGINPIAILPEDIFNKIVSKAGFYTFYRIQKENKVYGNGVAMNAVLNRKRRSSAERDDVVGGMMTAGLLTTGVLDLLVFSMTTMIAVHLITPIVAGLVAALLFKGRADRGEAVLLAITTGTMLPILAPVIILDRFFAKEPEEANEANSKHFDVLWPKGNDVDGVTNDLFKIEFPAPPDSVKSVLARCYRGGIETFTSAHPKAIRLILDDKKRNELYAKYDPIICTRENGMVAVIDQFGDFPEEKEVVAYIQEHFDSKRKKLIQVDNLN